MVRYNLAFINHVFCALLRENRFTILKIYTDGFEGARERSLERSRKMDRGERIKPSRAVTFDSPMRMFEVLTVERMRLIEESRKQRYTMSGLAAALGRDPKSVRRDVAKPTQAGVLRIKEQVNSGHGRVKIVLPVAKKIELRASF